MEKKMVELNMEIYNAESKAFLKSLRSILVTIIKTMPREEMIKVLKEKKIVKYEYLEEKDDLVLIERVNESIHSQVKKDKDDGSNVSLSGDTKQLQGQTNKDEHMPVSVDNQPDVIILDDNILSLSCYAEEYPENWLAMTQNINFANNSPLNKSLAGVERLRSEKDSGASSSSSVQEPSP